MTPLVRNSVAVTLAGALLASAATPTLARHGRSWAWAGAGFAAGALAGAAVANSYYYGPRYYYGPAYAPAPAYEVQYGPSVYTSHDAWGNCWVEESYGRRTPCSGY